RRTSELIKYAANAFLAVKITFINEMADLCEKVGANVQEVSRGIGLDNRIGRKFLNAGPGYGGSCFPKDTLALSKTANDVGAPVRIVDTVVEVNKARKKAMADKVIAAMGGDVKGKTIGVLGLAFKQNTDDMRDAPSLDILPALMAAGAKVRAYDPEAMTEAANLLEGVVFATSPYDAIQDSDAMVIITEWDQFRALDFDRVKAALNTNIVVDLRNIYSPEDMAARGFAYTSIGRP
ncbi:UDP-glucose dehydrogenase family protein, partial [Hyphomonas oceanitis]